MGKSVITRIKDHIWDNVSLIQSDIVLGAEYRDAEILNVERKRIKLIKQEETYDHRIKMSFELTAVFELIEFGVEQSRLDTLTAMIETEVRIYDTIKGTPVFVRIRKVSVDENEMEMSMELPLLARDAAQFVGVALEEAREFHISEKFYPTIADYITFRYQRNRDDAYTRHPEIMETYYNLLLYGDEGQIIKFVKVLEELFREAGPKSCITEENVAIESFDSWGKSHDEESFGDRWEYYDIVHIYNCQPQPFVNEDAGTGAAREESHKKAMKYRNFWKYIADFSKKHPDITLIVSMSEYVYKDTFLKNNELNYRIFSHKLCIPEITMEQALEMALQRFRSSSFTLAPDFEEKFTQYVHTIYQRAELKGAAFAEDAVNRVYALYFSK